MADNNQSETPADRNDYKKYITYALIGLAVLIAIFSLWYLIQHYGSTSGGILGNDASSRAPQLRAENATLADAQSHERGVSFLNNDEAIKDLSTAFKH